MTTFLVDSNVLIDITAENSRGFAWSADALDRAADRGKFIINSIIYAEVSIGYSRIEEMETRFPQSIFHREPISDEAAFMAGKAFVNYRRRGGVRRSPLPDFFIGAHAAIAGHTILTRDAARYRTYFPGVPLISPDT